jgi:integrase/recombinase XerD
MGDAGVAAAGKKPAATSMDWMTRALEEQARQKAAAGGELPKRGAPSMPPGQPPPTGGPRDWVKQPMTLQEALTKMPATQIIAGFPQSGLKPPPARESARKVPSSVAARSAEGSPRAKAARSNTLADMLTGYRLTAVSEGKKEGTVAIVTSAVGDLDRYLRGQGLSTDVEDIGVPELRAYMAGLRMRQPFSSHPFTHPRAGTLSGTTINGYFRALSAFWAYLLREEWIDDNPFQKLRIPPAPKKEMQVLTALQLQAIFDCVDTSTARGFRDYAVMSIMLDTGVRLTECNTAQLSKVDMNSRQFLVHGKGSKERFLPFGATMQKILWTYIRKYRPEPASPLIDNLFLTLDGRPLSKDRVEKIIKEYGRKAGITGIRVSPHTFRHTGLTLMHKYHMDPLDLQRVSGHADAQSLKGYVHQTQDEVNAAHRRSSPLDNLVFQRMLKVPVRVAATRRTTAERECPDNAEAGPAPGKASQKEPTARQKTEKPVRERHARTSGGSGAYFVKEERLNATPETPSSTTGNIAIEDIRVAANFEDEDSTAFTVNVGTPRNLLMALADGIGKHIKTVKYEDLDGSHGTIPGAATQQSSSQ